MIQLLLQHGADSNTEDEEGGSALQLVSRNGYDTCVAALLHANADACAPNRV